MPKIIENLRDNLLAETRRELLESGYESLNIRTIAKNCHAAVGTVYNYFPAKDILVANVMLEDWLQGMTAAQADIQTSATLADGVQALYREMLAFTDRYRTMFRQNAMPLAGSAYAQRHTQLRGQITAALQPLLCRFGSTPTDTTLTLAAEILLTAATEGWPFAQFYPTFEKILV